MTIEKFDLKDHDDYLEIFKGKININSACWWCTYEFDSLPVCAPIKYNSQKNLFEVHGFFCSFSCAKAHVLHKKSPYIDPALITLLNKRLTGRMDKIIVAPAIQNLEKYGGHLSIEEYRERCNPGLLKIVENQNINFKTYEDMQPYTDVSKNKIIQSKVIKENSQIISVPKFEKPNIIPESPMMIDENSLINRKRGISQNIQSPNKTFLHQQRSKNTLDQFMKITEKSIKK